MLPQPNDRLGLLSRNIERQVKQTFRLSSLLVSGASVAPPGLLVVLGVGTLESSMLAIPFWILICSRGLGSSDGEP